MIVFAAALLVRLLYVASIRHAPFFDHLQTEPLRYLQWASAILDGEAPATPPFDEAPGYPYLVASLFRLFGRTLAPIAYAQVLLDAGAAALMAALARRFGGTRAGWIAGVLATLYGPLIYFCGELLPAAPFVFAVAAAMVATPAEEDAASRRWTLAGAAWAATLLLRSEAALALPVVLLDAWLRGGRRALGRAAVVPFFFLAASLSLNLAVSRQWVLLTTGSGVNAWLGNNAVADGVSPFIHGPLEPVAAEVSQTAHDPVEADALFRARALVFWREHPRAALRLVARKVAWAFTDRELPNTSDIDWQTSQSALFRPPWFPLRFGVVFPLALAGAFLVGRSWRRHLILLAPLAIALGTSVVFFTNARFRLVLAVSMIPLAALAVDRLLALPAARPQRARTWALALTGLVIGSLAAWTNLDGVRAYHVPEIDVNTGVLERAAGHSEAAIRRFESALAADPDDAIAWAELTMTLAQAGRTADAHDAWRRANDRLPNHPVLREAAMRLSRRRPRGAPPP